MSRKDIILISVIINAGLLAVLFVTALKTETELPLPFEAFQKSNEPSQIAFNSTPVQEPVEVDEVDQILKEYLPELDTPMEKIIPAPAPKVLVKEEADVQGDFVEIKIKSGDALEKIARANRTTVDAIRKVNKLTNDKLKIGQVLKVPVGQPLETELKIHPVVATFEEPTYYVVKSGDNPWKIAKNHSVKFEDLLILNNLDEERAKNLKVGEKIRVR